MRNFLALIAAWGVAGSAWAELVAAWDFQTTSNGGTALVSGSAQPRVFSANFGLGTLYLDGSDGSSSWTASTTSSTEINAFGGTTVNASNGLSTVTSGSAALALVNATANGKYAVFRFSMAHRQDLLVTYASQRTTAGFTNQLWEASSNGINWVTITNVTSVQTNFSGTAVISLPKITVLNNVNPSFLRLSASGASSNGNNRLDNLQFHATAFMGPILTLFSPQTGKVGDLVTLSGANFGANPIVKFNGSVAVVSVNGAGTEIAATVPSGATTGRITVEVTGQVTATSPVDFTVEDASLLPPEVNGGTISGKVGVSLSTFFSASGNPTNFTVVAGNLPEGLSLNTSSGAVTGTPQRATAGANVQVSAANSAGSGTNTVTFQIAKGDQVIQFNALASLAAGGGPVAIGATASSGLTVSYVSSSPQVATVSAGNLRPAGEGISTITALQPGNGDWNAATPVSQSLRVYAANLITWNFEAATPSFGVPEGWSAGALVQGNNNGSTPMLGSTSASGGYTHAFGMPASGGNNAGAAAKPGQLDPQSSTYFEFSLTPNSGPSLTAITNVSFGIRSTSTGPQAFSLRSAADGYASDLAMGTVSNNSVWVLRSLTNLSLPLDPTAPNTYRLYGHGGTGTGTVGSANWRIDDLVLAVQAEPTVPVITSTNQVSGAVGEPFYHRITARGAPTIFAAEGLPAGLQLDPLTGWITGIPSQAVTGAIVTVTASNALGTGTAQELVLDLAPVVLRDVSFAVDLKVQIFMGLFDPATQSIELRADSPGWNDGFLLADGDGDGIYTGTFGIAGTEGAIRSYKFVVTGNGGVRWESLGWLNGQPVNRLLSLSAAGSGMQVATVFFSDQGQARWATFSVNLGPRLNQGAFQPLTDTVEVRGNFNEWAGGLTLSDPDGDAIYTGTLPVPGNAGAALQYLFYINSGSSGVYENLSIRTATLGADRQAMTFPTVFFSNDDGIGPVLTLLGDAEVNIPFGGSYTGLTATAVDAVDGARTVYTWTNLNSTVPGKYWIYYYAFDSASNWGWVARLVTVLPAVPVVPVISDLPNRSLPAGQASEPMSFTLSGFQPQRSLRAVAANLTSGNYSPARYDGPGSRILQGLQPDVVMIQEFNVADNSEAGLRSWVNSTFGSDFFFYREPGRSLPNGVISRWPILSSGFWDDGPGGVGDRELAWARIDIPGDKHLWVVSVHLKASAEFAATRDSQVQTLVSRIQAEVPPEDYLMIGGDFNAYSTAEACLTRIGTFVDTSDPRPVDQGGNPNTNAGRYNPYDWVMAEPELDALEIPVRLGAMSFSSGLVFDSRNFSDLSLVSPVLAGDSGAPAMQHMAVVRDFALPDASLLAVTVQSSDPALVPVENVVVSGSGLNRSLTVTPVAGRTGLAVITVTASEGVNQASDTFTVTVTAAGSNFAGWSGGATLDATNLGKYAIGGASSLSATDGVLPSSTVSGGNLVLTAIVRTDDNKLTVVGEAVASLADYTPGGTVSTVNGVDTADQTGVPTGCKRQTFTVSQGADSRKFLRLKATLAP